MSGTATTKNELPAWLTMRQARAWVIYRSANMILEAIERFGFPGPNMSEPEPPRIDRAEKLIEALQSERITAHVVQRDGTYRPISPVEWMSRPFVPVFSITQELVWRDELLKVFGPKQGKVPANRQLDHEAIIERARVLRAEQPNISIGSAASSIAAELPRNPTSKKPRDPRGIERIIADVWRGG